MIDVTWSATNDDDPEFRHPDIKRHLYLAPPWAEAPDNAESLAAELAADWLTQEKWHDLIGLDDEYCTVPERQTC